MNKLVKIFAVAMLVFTFVNVSAQTKMKFGHIESNKLMMIMPEMKKAQADLQKDQKELEKQMVSMQKEYQKLIQAFQKSEKTMSDVIKQAKYKEIQEAQKRIQDFQQYAQKALTDKRNKLMQPILVKANEAIKTVGKENKFTYIFDFNAGNILYKSNQSIDVLPLVKKKLGIQ